MSLFPNPLVTIIWTMVVSVVPYIVTYVIRGIGFGLVAYTGASLIFDQAEAWLFAKYDGLPADLFAILTILGIPTGFKMIFAAFAVALAIKTAVKPAHAVWKKPGSGFQA